MFGLRHEEDIFYDEFFTALSAEHDNFEYSLTLSQPKDTWQGREGRVPSLIRGKEFDLDNLRIFICGSQTMIEEVSSIFKEMGLSEERIHHEKFY